MRAVMLSCLVGIMLVELGVPSYGKDPERPPAKAEAKNDDKPKITVSKQTTRILGPKDDEGYVDYLAALNERMSEGVTPENNAAVPIWRASWPGEIPEDLRAAFAKKLGIERPQGRGTRFRSYPEWVEGKGGDASQASDDMLAATKKPWTKLDYAQLAEWLDEMEEPLDLAVAGANRPKYFSPLIDEDEPKVLLGTGLYDLHVVRVLYRGLIVRAMRQFGEDDFAKAWEDLMAVHRLARQIGSAPFLLHGLAAVAAEEMAYRVEIGAAQSGMLDRGELARLTDGLEAMAPLPLMVEKKLDVGERFMFLHLVQATARHGVEAIGGPVGQKDARYKAVVRITQKLRIDWNIPMEMGNEWFDKLVAALENDDRCARHKAIAQFQDEFHELSKQITDPKGLALLFFFPGKNAKQSVSEQLGGILVGMLFPVHSRVIDAEQRAAMRYKLTLATLTLETYAAKREAYPETLEALVPKYLPEVPDDRFGEGKVRYRKGEDGYLLYSVGINGKDDGGRDAEAEEPADDLVVRKGAAD